MVSQDGRMTLGRRGRAEHRVAFARMGRITIPGASRDSHRCVWLTLALALQFLAVAPGWGQWPDQQRIGPFNVHADFSVDRVRPLFHELDSLQRDLQELLLIGPMQEHVDVYLFARRDIYHQYMRQYFPQLGAREAMYIKSNSPGNVFAYMGPQFVTDLRHESTHAMLHAMLPLLPLWLDEGLAEYFEVPAGQRRDGNPYLGAVIREARQGKCPPLSRLEVLRDLSEFGPREYQDAWAYVHFMLHGPEPARRALLAYLADIRAHQPPQPISARLGELLGDTPSAFVRHFQQWHR